jgi:hypothetical protein
MLSLPTPAPTPENPSLSPAISPNPFEPPSKEPLVRGAYEILLVLLACPLLLPMDDGCSLPASGGVPGRADLVDADLLSNVGLVARSSFPSTGVDGVLYD